MASRLQDVILRGLAADKPLATTVAPGTLYYSTDTSTTDRSDGTTWETYSDAGSGIVAVHAPSHVEGGSDELDVKLLGGYPGGGTTFLRDDGIFTTPTFTPPAQTRSITMLIDGGTSVITTGVKGYIEIPFACTIQAVTLLANISGSIVVDIWKDTYANYPPVVGDSICASAKPTISAALKSQDTTLTGWTTAVAAGDVLGFNVDSVSTMTKASLNLKVQIP